MTLPQHSLPCCVPPPAYFGCSRRRGPSWSAIHVSAWGDFPPGTSRIGLQVGVGSIDIVLILDRDRRVRNTSARFRLDGYSTYAIPLVTSLERAQGFKFFFAHPPIFFGGGLSLGKKSTSPGPIDCTARRGCHHAGAPSAQLAGSHGKAGSNVRSYGGGAPCPARCQPRHREPPGATLGATRPGRLRLANYYQWHTGAVR